MRLRFPWIFFVAFLLLGVMQASAQTQTTVTGQVVDPNGIPYSGARLVITLNNPGPGSPTYTPCHNPGAGCPVQVPGPITLDAQGNIPGGGVVLYANASISVNGVTGTTSYNFQVNQNPGVLIPWGTGPQIFTLPNVTISGASQNLTAAFTAVPPPALTQFGNAIVPGGGDVPIINGSVVTVDGHAVTTIAQALTLLPSTGGVIDARSCAPTSLAIGDYDPVPAGETPAQPTSAVTLLLGACTYTFDQIFEEPDEYIIGVGSYSTINGTILISTNITNGAALIRENTKGNDSTNMRFSNFTLAQCSTFVGCTGVGQTGISINPSQTNVSADMNIIDHLTIFTDGPQISLNGPGTAIDGENTVGSALIYENYLIPTGSSSATAIQVEGSVAGVEILNNEISSSITGPVITLSKGSGQLVGVNMLTNRISSSGTPTLFSNSGATQVSAIGNMNLTSGTLINDSWSDPFLPARYAVASLPSAATVGAGAVATVSDALTSTAGTCVGGGSNTTIAVSNGTAWNCLQSGASGASVQLFVNQNLVTNHPSGVSVSANTLTAIDSVTINACGGSAPAFPCSGGPFRAKVDYTYFNDGGVNVECYVSDGTNNWGLWEQSTTSNISECAGWQSSPVTYTGNASVTFTVWEENTGATTVQTIGNIVGSVPSSVQVSIFASN